jgi:branched-chain amino acid transport system substrate-binding protein
MKHNIIYTTLCTLLLTIPLYATRAEESLPQVTIGGLLCLTGDCAEYGTNAHHGVLLALDTLNSRGGILKRKVSLTLQDSGDSTPKQTVVAYQKLTQEEKLPLIIGPTWTIGAMSVAPLMKHHPETIVISPSVGMRDFNETAPHIFNTWPHDEIATRKLAHHAIKNGWKKIAILSAQEPWVTTQTQVFQEELLALGGAVTVSLAPLPSTRDLRTEALQIKNSRPDAIFIANYQSDIIAKELQKLKVTIPLMVILMEKNRVLAANGALEGAIFGQYEASQDEFVKAFKNKFNAAPGISADTAYDAVMLYAQAVETAQTFEANAVQRALTMIRNFKGASGTFSMNEQGAVVKTPVIWRIRGESYERVTP